MTKVLLVLIALAALLYGISSIPEMLIVSTSSEATVWQQISARLAIGLSLLIFAVATGLAALLLSFEQHERTVIAGVDKIVAALGGAQAPAATPPPADTRQQLTKAEERRQRLAARMGVTLPTEEEEQANRPQLERDAAGIALNSGFVVREKNLTKDALDQAVEKLYSKPPALR